MTTASYEETYHLKLPPFADDIDDRFFYGGSSLMQRLDLLTHLTRFGESIILVCGPAGSGKSTLLRHYISHAAAQWRICALNAHAFDRFTSLLADALNIESGHNELESLEQWTAGSDASQLLVVVIDDAEQLDDTAFQRLDALLRHPHHDRVRLLLFGTQQLNRNIQEAQQRQLISSTTQPLEIPKLTEEETASYLMYRLAVAGYSGESPFTATEIRGMCKAAEGRPGDINKLAHLALEERQARIKTQKKKPRQKSGKNHTILWAAASVVAVSLAAYLGWQRMEPSGNIGSTAGTAQISTQETPLSLPPAYQTSVQDPVSEVSAAEQQQDAVIATREAADIATILPAARPKATPDKTGALESSAATATSPRAEKQNEAADTESGIAIAATEPAEPETVKKPEPEVAVTPPAPAPLVGQPQPVPAANAGSAPAETQAAETDTDGPHREPWLLQQDSASFSLQLLGSRSEQAVSEFIQKHKLSTEKTAYYLGTHQGKPWYVLMYGSYPSRKAALEARSELPATVRKGNPWPREMKSVQKAIRESS